MYKKIILWNPDSKIKNWIRKFLLSLFNYQSYPEFRKFSFKPLLRVFKILFYSFLLFFMIEFITNSKRTKENLISAYMKIEYVKKNALSLFYNDAMDSLKNSESYLRYQVFQETGINVPKKLPIEDLKHIINTCDSCDIPLKIAIKVIHKETGGTFDSTLTSNASAFGLMQIMPTTFRMYYSRLKLKNGRTNKNNITIGINVLKTLYDIFENHKEKRRWQLTLASYNAGIRRVLDAKGVPNIPETQDYVKKILEE